MSGPAPVPIASGRGHRRLGVLCLATMGGLAAAQSSWIVGAGSFLVLGFMGLGLTGWVISLANHRLKAKHESAAIRLAVRRPLALLVPFTVLALFSQLFLGWHAALSFLCAGIMASAGATGVELVSLGARRVAGVFLPLVLAIMLSGFLALAAAAVGSVGAG